MATDNKENEVLDSDFIYINSKKVSKKEFKKRAKQEFEWYKANSKFSPENNARLEEAFNNLLNGVESGHVRYNSDKGGFSNTLGYKDNLGDFTAYGYSSWILGETLRNMEEWEDKEAKEREEKKTKYKGTKDSISPLALRRLLGEGLNPKYFADLDPFDSESGKRSQAKRIQQTRDFLKYLSENWDNEFTGFTDAQKQEWLDNYALYGNIDINNNGVLDPDEYLGLSKLLGIGDLDQLFYTTDAYTVPGQTSAAATETLVDTRIAPDSQDYISQQQWRETNHPRSKAALKQRQLIVTNMYNNNDNTRLRNVLSQINTDNLLYLVQQGLKYRSEGNELNRYTPLLKGFNLPPDQITNFDNDFIIKETLEVLRNRGDISPIQEGSNDYLIPFKKASKLDQRGTAYVYRIDPNGNHSLVEMDRNDIPYYTKQWDDDYFSVYQPQPTSYKEGGTLVKKLEYGGTSSPFESLFYGENDDEYRPYKLQFRQNVYDPKTKKFTQAVRDPNFTVTPSKYDKTKYKKELGGLELEQTPEQQQFYRQVESDPFLAEEYAKYLRKNLGSLYISNYYGWWDDQNKFNHEQFLNTWKRYDHKNGTQHDRTLDLEKGKRGKTYVWNGADGKEYFTYDNIPQWLEIEEGDWNDGGYYDYKRLIRKGGTGEQSYTGSGTESDPHQLPELVVTPETYNPEGGDYNPEIGPGNALPDLDFGGVNNDWLPFALETGALGASYITNNKKYRAMDKALKPELELPLWRQSGVYGDEGTKQYYDKLANDVLQRTQRNMTSDANLNSAMAFEAIQRANDYRIKGILADNAKIDFTRNKQLENNHFSEQSRITTANRNMASIIQSNIDRANLFANWEDAKYRSLSNYLMDIALRTRAKNKQKEELQLTSSQRQILDNASNWYNRMIDQAEEFRTKWEGDPENEDKDFINSEYWDKYNGYKKAAGDIYTDYYNYYNNKLLGLKKLDRKYKDSLINMFNWNAWKDGKLVNYFLN